MATRFARLALWSAVFLLLPPRAALAASCFDAVACPFNPACVDEPCSPANTADSVAELLTMLGDASYPVICVAPGTYFPTSTIVISRPVVIQGPQRCTQTECRTPGDADEEAIIDGSKGSASSFNWLANIIRIEASDVTITGLEVRNGRSDLISGVGIPPITSTTHNVRIEYNIIHGSKHPSYTPVTTCGGGGNCCDSGRGDEGVQLRKSRCALLQYNLVYDVDGSCLNISATSQYGTIQYNRCDDVRTRDGAIFFYQDSGTLPMNACVYHNEVSNVTRSPTWEDNGNCINFDEGYVAAGIQMGTRGGDDATTFGGIIAENVITDTDGPGIMLYSKGNTVKNNDVSDSRGTIRIACTTGCNTTHLCTVPAVCDGRRENVPYGAVSVRQDIENTSILSNSIHDNNNGGKIYGVHVGVTNWPQNTQVHDNCIYGNDRGLYYHHDDGSDCLPYLCNEHPLNATGNYWGAASGPLIDPVGCGVYLGAGQIIKSEPDTCAIDASGYLAACPPGHPGISPWPDPDPDHPCIPPGCTDPTTITCPTGGTVSTDADSCTWAYLATATGCAPVSISCTPASPLGVGAHSVTCTATSSTLQTANCSFNVTVEDNELPVVECENLNLECDEFGPVPPADDNCGIDDLTSEDVLLSESCTGKKSIQRTWTATDIYGNMSSCVQVLTYVDPNPPVLGEGVLGDCYASEEAAENAAIAATTSGDDCPGPVTLSVESAGGPCELTITVTGEDSCGNTDSVVYGPVTVDGAGPTLTPGTLEDCYATEAEAEADAIAETTVSDDCPGSVDVVAETTGPPCAATITVTATDACGHSAAHVYSPVKIDGTDPVLTAGVLAACYPSEAAAEADAIASTGVSDNCPGAVDVVAETTGSPCTATITVTATDACGNSAAYVYSPVKIDGTDPMLTTGTLAACYASEAEAEADAIAKTGVSDNCPGTVDVVAETTGGPCAATITVTATDACGNTASHAYPAVKIDSTDPVLTPGTLAACYPSEAAAEADAIAKTTVDDNCPGTVDVVAETTGDPCAASITVTATDSCGNSASYTYTPVKIDGTAPVLTPGTLASSYPNEAAAEADAIAKTGVDDNCPGPVDVVAETTGDPCAASIKVTATDACGNSASHTYSPVRIDGMPPTVVPPPDINVFSDSNACGTHVEFEPTVSDNCPGPYTLECRNASTLLPVSSGDFFPVGTTTVECRAKDAADNYSGWVSFTITVVDNVKPVITYCPTQTLGTDYGKCTAYVVINATATDNCEVEEISCTLPSDHYGVGTHTGSCTATDIHGNSETCDFTITVTDDEDPVITCPVDMNVDSDAGECGAAVDFDPAVTDNCDSTPTVVCVPPSGSIFPVGTTQVMCSATDDAGNSSSCQFSVTVEDNEDPVLVCGGTQTFPTDAGECGADDVDYVPPTAQDNCPDVEVVCDPPPGSDFPIGTTLVTCTATDDHGNTDTCSFNVVIEDKEDPVIDCPDPVSAQSEPGACGAEVNFVPPTATDNCDPTPEISCTKEPGDFFTVGVTVVTCTATDNDGNDSQCTFTVTVTDGIAPVMSPCPADIAKSTDAGDCGAVVNFVKPTAEDNCDGDVEVTCDHQPGDVFPVGSTTVTCTAEDAAGNESSCSFEVVVTDDEDPTITCPANITTDTAPGTCSKTVTWAPPVVDDNCGVQSVVCVPPSGSSFTKGTWPVTCTVTDIHENTKACNFTVTVEDNEPPVVTGPPPITVVPTPGMCGAIVTFSASATDNCDGPIAVTCTPPSGSFFPSGTTLVTCTATDSSGNDGTYQFTVTVGQNCGTVGDFVWYDIDFDGIQDPGEPGFENVKVTLKCTSQADRIDYTDASGLYLFEDILFGSSCTVHVETNAGPLLGYSQTPTNQGGDDTKDNDPLPDGPFTVTGTHLDHDYGFAFSQGFCPPGSCTSTPSPLGTLWWAVLPNGDVRFRYDQSTAYNDNVYGKWSTVTGWKASRPHRFSDLINSDNAQFIFKNGNGQVVFDFVMDYATAKSGTPSGYASLGVTGGDGKVNTGTASWLNQWNTSLARNLNDYGYCVGGNCNTCGGIDLKIDSPKSTAAFVNISGCYPSWNYVDSFEGTVSAAAFGGSGFGGIDVGDIHNSPPKAGAAPCNPIPCVAPPPPPPPFVCSAPVKAFTVEWTDGKKKRTIDVWENGVKIFSNVAVNTRITRTDNNGLPANLTWTLKVAGTSTLVGDSYFVLNCSDPEMNGPEDCSKWEGNGIGSTGINTWKLKGIKDSDQEFTCP